MLRMAGYELTGKNKFMWVEANRAPGDRTHVYIDMIAKRVITNGKSQKHFQSNLLNRLNEIMQNETRV